MKVLQQECIKTPARLFIALVFISIATLMMSTGSLAQNINLGDEISNREVFKMGLYPPDVIMRQQQRLGITEKQRKSITTHVNQFQSEVTELQWSMPTKVQEFRQMMNEQPIDKAKALEHVAEYFEMESEFKMSHFKLLIAIKNELTEEQIAQLNKAIRQRTQQQRN